MVDVQRVKVMTQLAAFEEKESKRALCLHEIVKDFCMCYHRICFSIGFIWSVSMGIFDWKCNEFGLCFNDKENCCGIHKFVDMLFFDRCLCI